MASPALVKEFDEAVEKIVKHAFLIACLSPQRFNDLVPSFTVSHFRGERLLLELNWPARSHDEQEFLDRIRESLSIMVTNMYTCLDYLIDDYAYSRINVNRYEIGSNEWERAFAVARIMARNFPPREAKEDTLIEATPESSAAPNEKCAICDEEFEPCNTVSLPCDPHHKIHGTCLIVRPSFRTLIRFPCFLDRLYIGSMADVYLHTCACFTLFEKTGFARGPRKEPQLPHLQWTYGCLRDPKSNLGDAFVIVE